MNLKSRVRILNAQPVRPDARYVLYWSQMNRRVDGNHALLHAAELANSLNLPVLYYEGLTCSYPHANDRLHTFILEGVPDTERRLGKLGIGYAFDLRRRLSDADDALSRLAANAAAIVTDDYPTFIAARHNSSVPVQVGVACHAVDSSCVVPMNLLEKREYAAYTFRPKIRRLLAEYLVPHEPLKVRKRFAGPIPPFHTQVDETRIADLVVQCEIDHSVAPSVSFRGGRREAEKHLEHFVRNNLRRYARHKNEPSEHATSDMSPYLHFGYISSLEIALRVREHALEHKLFADEYLEELIVRRELAFNFARHTPPPYTLDCLPEWAKTTLGKHARDRRSPCYTREQFERAGTHDALWNATQNELLLRGKIHGYYRMYWGKKVIEWSATHEEALETMIHLHDRYALDGRDPNTYTNILWCFGLHDRPWSERPVFGIVRYMSLDGMKRKTDVGAYLAEIAEIERTGSDPHRLK